MLLTKFGLIWNMMLIVIIIITIMVLVLYFKISIIYFILKGYFHSEDLMYGGNFNSISLHLSKPATSLHFLLINAGPFENYEKYKKSFKCIITTYT